MTVWDKFKKSKTMWFSMLLTTLGVIELNMHLFYNMLGEEYYGVTYMIIALVTGWLRVITTTSLEDK
jgi:hypothetical protein